MSAPAPFRLYMTLNAASASNMPGATGTSGFGVLSLNTASYATTTRGWNVGTLTAPRYVFMNFSVEVVRTATNPAWNTVPSSSLSSSLGNAWVYGPLEGDFDDGVWEITQSAKSTTLGSTHLGRFIYSIHKANNLQASGSRLLSASFIQGATGVTASFVSSSLATSFAATTTQNRMTASFTLGPQSFRNEYLFIQEQWNVTTAGGGNNADVNWIVGELSASVRTPTYISYEMRGRLFQSDDWG
jgi:hypothetical protein